MVGIPELNVIKKDWRKVDLKVALCYPNVYRAGMTGLTVRLLYALFNMRQDVLCERFFIPTLREPLRSLESNQPLEKFDVIAFTLQYEEDYVNLIRMLLESHITLAREERSPKGPILVAGGPCATANPEPLAEFFDLFVIGEAEDVLDLLIDRIKSFKNPTKHIEEFADLEGVYVPKVSNPVKRVWVRNLDDAFHPLEQPIPLVDSQSPYMPVFGESFAVEAVRGCNRGCRFCLIGHIGRPKRERSLARLEEIMDEGLRFTPVKKVSLIGADLSEHSDLESLCQLIVSRGLELSIPSIRPEAVTERLAKMLVKGRQRTVSIAPDGSCTRLRRIINKSIDDDVIVEATKTLFESGIKRLKLYYMIGLPGETVKDIEYIAELSKRITDLGYGSRSVHLNVNPFVPKPQTSFQWEGMPSVSYVRDSINFLRRLLRGDKRLLISCLDPRHARVQAFLSLGDRKIGNVIEMVARYGGGLGSWRRALRESKVSMDGYIKGKTIGGPLPWDHVDVGLNKGLLIREAENARKMTDVYDGDRLGRV